MKHPIHYEREGLKRKAVHFLMKYELLTTRQQREIMESYPDKRPTTHEEFIEHYPIRIPESQMTRQQLEEAITRPFVWGKERPTANASGAAFALASAGELGGPDSSLGPTREAALRLLRRYLPPWQMASIEIALDEYDRTGPHPPHVFGTGWTEADARRRQREADEREWDEGRPSYNEWLAERRSHLHLLLFDGFVYVRNFFFGLMLRGYRELRYR